MFSRLFRRLQPLVLCLAVLAIAWFLRSHWATLAAYPWRLDAGWLAAASGLLLLAWALEVAIWRHLLYLVGGRLGYLQAIRIWFLSAVVRYIPGNIWQPLSMTLYCRRYAIAPEVTLTSVALFQAVVLLAVVPIFAVYLVWDKSNSLAAQMLSAIPPMLIGFLFLPVLVFVMRPQWLTALLNWGLVRLRRAPLQARLTSPTLLGLVAVATVDWLLWGATFAAFAFGVSGVDAAERAALAPLMVVAYPIAYAAGFLSLITPSGFGVREGALYLLLTPPLDGAVVTVVALAMRVWTTIGELLLALLSAPFERASSSSSSSSSAAPFAPPPVEHSVEPELHSNVP